MNTNVQNTGVCSSCSSHILRQHQTCSLLPFSITSMKKIMASPDVTQYLEDIKEYGLYYGEVVVRIIRLVYKYRPSGVDHVYMVLIDEHVTFTIIAIIGHKIEAVANYDVFRSIVPTMEEGEIRSISHFTTAQVTTKTVGHHGFKIYFDLDSLVVYCDQAISIPHYGFDFVYFDHIFKGKINDKALVDVVGVIHHYEIDQVVFQELPHLEGLTFSQIDIWITGNDNLMIKCTLIGDDFTPQLENFTKHGNKVAIFQFAQIVKSEVFISLISTSYMTRLFINDNIAEIDSFVYSYLPIVMDQDDDFWNQIGDGDDAIVEEIEHGRTHST